ncbi:poly-gamma-glutamate system protein [Aliidiomarina sedimenti]|uniref:Poly-gamma-glutamate system protein n=1 Tax=Aliidiomarina sedimenti TaxID=1933879 RepID=A0ABY0BXA8_9GAMM|nr:poly-gamma-glutamate system protein [Aliidiomarina sedimenti]RUO28796.1 poly-gamma-glutamate system protein [Aliidiomarina sedimenti]
MSKYTKIYWRSSQVPAWGLIFLAAMAIVILLAAEKIQVRDPVIEEHYSTMVAASGTVRDSYDVIRSVRSNLRPINPETDPQRSGLIGPSSSEVTTTIGGLESKQTSVNPNWGAVAVKLLADAEVEEGDLVAVAVSGSFPALNIAVYAAIEALGAEAVIIASGSSSQYGANLPGLLWLDMERELRDADLLTLRPVAASIGGVEDRGADLSAEGRSIIREAIERSGASYIQPSNYQEAVADRIALYREHSSGRPFKAFINVGGGATIVGPPSIDSLFAPGLLRNAPARAFAVDTVMGYFLREGVPAIHFIGVKDMAERYGLPIASRNPVPVGDGGVYSSTRYSRILAFILGLILVGLTWLMVRSGGIIGFWNRQGHSGKGVKPMV